MLIAAMNPCPCGYYGSKVKRCTCSEKQVANYMGKISGPLLDRFDMHIDVDPVKYEDLASVEKAESSAVIRERIEKARQRQEERFKGTGIYCNAMIPDHLLGEYCHLNEPAKGLLRAVHSKYAVSARAFNRIQRVALSVADMMGHSQIIRSDLAMAVQYRGFNSQYLNLN
jgi:magnesium chelatase family protein